MSLISRFRWTTSENELDSHDERDKYTIKGYVHYCRDDGEAMAKSEGYVAENGFVATDPTHFGKAYHDKQSRQTCCPWGCLSYHLCLCESWGQNLNEIRFRSDVYKMLSEPGKSAPYAIPDTKFGHFSEREFEEKVAPHVTMLIKQMRWRSVLSNPSP